MPTRPRKCVTIIGAGGHALVVVEALRGTGWVGEILLRDDDEDLTGSNILDNCVLFPAVPLSYEVNTEVHVAIGNNSKRDKLAARSKEAGATLLTIIHKRATISPSAKIGNGSFVAAGAVIGPKAIIGENVIVNHSAVVDHECHLGDSVHIAPGAILGGNVKIGSRTLIGAGAKVLPGIQVSENAVVGAGAVVLANVRPSSTVVGVPARAIGSRRDNE